MIAGATLCVTKPLAWLDVEYLKHSILVNVTSFWGVPSPFAMLIDTLEVLPPCLVDLHLSGEALPPGLVRFILNAQHVQLFNPYGPAEVTINSHAHKCTLDDANGPRVSIGGALPNTIGIVVDNDGFPVPIVSDAELCLGGPKVARGYIGSQQLTNQVFLTTPHFPGRMYKTGDRVRWLPSGDLEFLGRVDFQIKLNGQRVEAGEIEMTLKEFVSVRDALVLLQATKATGECLVAYVLPAKVDVEGVKTHCRSRLPGYMVPSTVVSISSWPLNSAGKVDRARLPLPSQWLCRSQETSTGQAKCTSSEQVICNIFSTVLGYEHVQPTSEFFAMGGDSISAIRVRSLARQRGFEFSVADLMAKQTPQSLAAMCSQRPTLGVVSSGSSIRQSGSIALTPMYQWFFSHKFNDSFHWNQAISLGLHGSKVDETRLRDALQVLQSHHDMLRCRFTEDCDGIWHATIPTHCSTPPHLLVIAEGTSDAATKSALDRAQSGLDLSSGPIWSAVLLRAQNRVVLIFHHLVVDAVSWRILEEDLSHAYSNEALPDKTTDFPAWSKSLNEYLDTIPVWTPPLPRRLHRDMQIAPKERILSQNQDIHVQLGTEITAQLMTCAAKAMDARPLELMLAALALANVEWCGDNELGILLEGHGRDSFNNSVDVSRTVGWFTALCPISLNVESGLDIESDKGIIATLRMVQAQLSAVPTHIRQYGVRNRMYNVECLQLPELKFNYLGHFQGTADGINQGFQLDGGWTGTCQSKAGHATSALSLDGAVVANVLRTTWNFNTAEFKAESVQAFADAWIRALTRVVAIATRVDRSKSPHINPQVGANVIGLCELSAAPPTQCVSTIGMACILGGGVNKPGQLWHSLCTVHPHITNVPPSRWKLACERTNAPSPYFTGCFIDLEAVTLENLSDLSNRSRSTHRTIDRDSTEDLDLHIKLLVEVASQVMHLMAIVLDPVHYDSGTSRHMPAWRGYWHLYWSSGM